MIAKCIVRRPTITTSDITSLLSPSNKVIQSIYKSINGTFFPVPSSSRKNKKPFCGDSFKQFIKY